MLAELYYEQDAEGRWQPKLNPGTHTYNLTGGDNPRYIMERSHLVWTTRDCSHRRSVINTPRFESVAVHSITPLLDVALRRTARCFWWRLA